MLMIFFARACCWVDDIPKHSQWNTLDDFSIASNMEDQSQEHSKKCRWLRINWKWCRVGRLDFGIFLRFNPVVSFLSALIIWGFATWCMVKAQAANEEMGRWKEWITHTFTWMYIGTQDVWAFLIIILYFSKYGNLKLGKPNDKPDYNDATYFTMLFAAGIGIGLFYFGVGELFNSSN